MRQSRNVGRRKIGSKRRLLSTEEGDMTRTLASEKQRSPLFMQASKFKSFLKKFAFTFMISRNSNASTVKAGDD